MANFYKQIADIQRSLVAPKSQWNGFGKYHYRSCEDILDGLKKCKGDLILLIDDQVEQIGDRFYVKATCTLTDGENSISSSAYARESFDKKGMDAAQITGACSSYARKYALCALLCIDDTKDADTMDNKVDHVSAINGFKSRIEKAQNMAELKSAYDEATKYAKSNNLAPELKTITQLTNLMKANMEQAA